MLIVFTTMPDFGSAETLAEKILARKLAACVQILPQMTSVYLWEGRLQKEAEHLLLIKTLSEKWEEIREFITANHNYSVPEIVAIDAGKTSDAYLEWMKDSLQLTTDN
jgi:periplasmic divalent cation tolerance protein